MLHRRVQMFDLRQQTLQVFPLLVLSYAVFTAVQWQVHHFIVWEYFIGSVTSTMMWAPLTLLLQSLRLRKGDSDRL